ncbi:hypothetical protein WICPIJ_000136 [Wickerhamomyces pijperi]|uniref:acid phosphatase n=1 Tax=Wickerhamomyces pijperi TaxID=599730 RepID=A0A9P8TS81_WICPI|nr:hypothetical protein WICPIJ_000136 [Wickerhamomyces pijperi]
MKFSLSLSAIAGAITVVEAASNKYPASKPYSQDSVDIYSLLRYTGTTGPYVQHLGYGIDPEVPFGCEVSQVHAFTRHFERYATTGTGKSNKAIIAKLKAKNVTEYVGPLAFLKDYEYYVTDNSRLESESNAGYYSGLGDGYNYGSNFRMKYDHLYDGNSTLPIFTAGQERCVASARAFGQGFFGVNYTDLCSIQVLPEKATQGANTLTASNACAKYNSSTYDYIVNEFDDSYLTNAAVRLNIQSPGFNISASDVNDLLSYCGFELNVRGFSPVCEIFTKEDLINFSYQKSLNYYYENGPGYEEVTGAIGYVYANNTYTLMEKNTTNMTLSFSHDGDIFFFTTALGLFDSEYDLTPKYVDFQHPYRVSDMVPMGARLVHEKLECTNYATNATESFVRVLLNDAVIPVPGCQDGPGFSCPLDGYKNVIDERIGNSSYIEACGVNSTYPQYTSFYWNWTATTENNF